MHVVLARPSCPDVLFADLDNSLHDNSLISGIFEDIHHYSTNFYELFWCCHYTGDVRHIEPDTWSDIEFSKCESLNHIYI